MQDEYRPPATALEAPRRPRNAGPVRVLLGVLGGFSLDVVLTTMLSTAALYVFYASVPVGDYPQMDLSNPASLRDAWAVLDVLISGGCSVLGGYVAARVAFAREPVAFVLVAVLHVIYGALPEALVIDIDWAAFARSTAFNWASTLLGVFLRLAQLRHIYRSTPRP